MPPHPVTSPARIRQALLDGTEIALLDMRMESEFAHGHPLFAGSFPLGQLESLAAERLPRPGTPLVVDGTGATSARRPCGRSWSGNRAFLEWEYGLVAQLDRDGTHGFSVLLP